MDVAAFCRQSRVLIVAGKGGVGKTTVCAALALMAAEAGLSVLVVELEGKSGLAARVRDRTAPRVRRIGARWSETETGGEVFARRITPDDALLEYLADHGMKRFSKRLVSSGALDVVATAIPGIRDILVLGKVKQLERDDPADLSAPRRSGDRARHDVPVVCERAARRGPVRARSGRRRRTSSSSSPTPTAAASLS